MLKMRIHNIIAVAILLIFSSFGIVKAQTAAPKPSFFSGDIAAITAHSITINTKNGPVEIALNEKTAYKKASAADFNPLTATAGAFAEVIVGDKVTVSALPSADGKTFS